MILEDYFNTAKANESTFRQVISDLKENKRPGSDYFPKDLNLDLSLSEIYKKYSSSSYDSLGHRILYFKVDGNKAVIAFDENKEKKKFGFELRYIIEGEDVKFDSDLMDWEYTK